MAIRAGADLSGSVGIDVALSRARAGSDELGAGGRGPVALGEAAVQFETVLLRQLVVAMRETVSLDGEPQGDQLTNYLIEDALATHLARAGGIGLAELLVRDAEGPPAPSTRDNGLDGLAPAPFAPLATFALPDPDALDVAAPTRYARPLDARGSGHLGATAPHDTPPAPDAAIPGPIALPTADGPRPLASRLPPQSDAWLSRPDAAAVLRRYLRPSQTETSKDD